MISNPSLETGHITHITYHIKPLKALNVYVSLCDVIYRWAAFDVEKPQMQNFEFIDFSFKRNHLKDTLNYILSWDNGTVSLTRLTLVSTLYSVWDGNLSVKEILFSNIFYFSICLVLSHNEFYFKLFWNIDGLNCRIRLNISFSSYQTKIQQYTGYVLLRDFYMYSHMIHIY